MISIYDVKKYITDNEDKIRCYIDGNNVIDKETGMVLCSIEEFTMEIRKAEHCNFESVYYCHGTLQNTIRCCECGTVIFASDDSSDYDPNLKCPVCGKYETWFEFWTKDEIESDKKKKDTIDFLEQMQREAIEADKRYVERGHLYDWQICKGAIKLLNKALYWELQCDNLFKTKFKGLRLQLNWSYKDGMCYISKKFWTIPLSISNLKSLIRYRKMKKNKEI